MKETGNTLRLPILPFLLSLAVSSFCAVDSVENRSHTIISSDSAKIISPKHRTILNESSVEYTVKPSCPVSGIDLFVNYYPLKTDTLARLTAPPFSALWNNAHIPDQDQLHLQFGYILYHVNGDTIVSPPQPHHWIIDRTIQKSRKRYVCKQAHPDREFLIDGNLDEWKRFRRTNFASGGGFRCSWTAADFFLAVEVYDPFVTAADRVEVCFDLTRSRSRFLTVDQRIISFGPKSRSFTWAVDISDIGSTLVDSIIIRIDEEMEYRCRLTDYGYLIEARIPFCVLSVLEFPQKYFGFDIAIINKNDTKQRESTVYTWSGTEPSGRHNPNEWGTVALRQLLLPLKLILTITFFLVILLLTAMVFLILYKKRKDYYYEKLEQKELSPMLKKVIDIIETRIEHPDLQPDDIAREYGCSVYELERVFKHELNSSCHKHIILSRIKKAKSCLTNSDISIEDVSHATGFTDTSLFTKTFKSLAGVTPDEWRKNRLKDALEDEEDIEENGKKSGDN